MRNQKTKQLLQLVIDNQQSPKNFEVKNADSDEATIYLYDAIDPWWGISAESFVRTLNDITASTIHLRINSPGGDVFEARAIATAIQQHKSKVIAHIDGLAASAATYVAIAAEEVHISEGSFFMIHKGWTFALGNADELRSTAGLLDKVDASIVNDYQKKTGIEADQLTTWMSEETWFSAEEAVEHGFADTLYTGEGEAPQNASHWQLNAYSNAPKALTEKPEPKFNNREALIRRAEMYSRIG